MSQELISRPASRPAAVPASRPATRLCGGGESSPPGDGVDNLLLESGHNLLLESDDVLVVWRLDRLGRSMRHLITLVEDLRDRGIGFRSLQEGAIDTTSASGELIFNIFSALAQFERRLIQERTKAGLEVARARGRHGGRPRLESEEAKVLAANKLAKDTSISIDDICKTLNISRSTYYRYLAMRPDDPREEG